MCAARVVSIASMKGGVGKTTLTLSLAEGSAALKRKRTLVVDLDPQINASTLLTGRLARNQVPWRTGSNILDLLKRRLSHGRADSKQYVLSDVVEPVNGRTVSLLSGHYELRRFERDLLVRRNQTVEAAMSFSRSAVADLLEEQKSLYDLIVVDCPPGFSLLTEAALSLSDLVILPTAPNNLGTQGLLAFINYLKEEVEVEDASHRTHVFLTMTGRTKTATEFERQVRATQSQVPQPYRVFESSFPYAVGFQEAMDRREWRMRTLGVVQTRLNQLRNRSLFRRLYDGVEEHVKRVVNEVWDCLPSEGVANERLAVSGSARAGRHPEARP